MVKTIDGIVFLNMLRAGAQKLSENRTTVNDLNVFPQQYLRDSGERCA